MKKESEFDEYAFNYEAIHKKILKITGFDPDYFAEYKIKEVFNYLKKQDNIPNRINFLNYGCGTGKTEKFIKKYFPKSHIYSIDISSESIKIAQQNNKGLLDVEFKVFNGLEIPYAVNFDLILAANVFHHISPSKHISALKALYSKLAEKGYLFIFEHNPFNLLTVRAVKDCELDKNAKLLKPYYANKILKKSGFKNRKLKFIIFFPKFLTFLLFLEKYIHKFPLGAQYYFIAQKD